LPTLALNEFSAREIQTFAEDLEKTNKNFTISRLIELLFLKFIYFAPLPDYILFGQTRND